MPRPVTLFTGQWADLPFEEVARLASGWGYDGLEIACWGDHLDPWRWDDDEYVAGKLATLEKYGLKVYAISNHLKGQAVCDDPIDQRHRDILPDVVWGDGDPEGVRQRAAEEMKHTARIAAKLGVKTVVGFTGSSIWKYVAMFPPVSQEAVDAGEQPTPSFEDGLAVQRVLDAVERSAGRRSEFTEVPEHGRPSHVSAPAAAGHDVPAPAGQS